MKKSELLADIAGKTGLTQGQAKAVIDTLAWMTAENLRKNGEALLPGIGKLATAARAPRMGRNPQTGESVSIPASTTVRFKPSSDLKSAVQ